MQKPRIDFEIIRKKYANRGKENVRLTQSSLLLIQAINSQTTTINFDVLDSQVANLLPQEIRLNINDEFIITEIGAYLYGKIVTQTRPSGVPIMLPYSPIELNENFAVLNPFYDGQLKIGVNNIVYVEKWDLKKHNCIPRTQFDSYDSAASLMASQPSIKYADDGMFGTDPMITLSGAKKNEISISLPQALAAASANWITPGEEPGVETVITIDKVALMLRGLNAQNAAKFQ